MGFKVGSKVEVVDKDKINMDKHLEETALAIIAESSYSGEITKIQDDIHFVGFKNDMGWVTQGFKNDEIKEVE